MLNWNPWGVRYFSDKYNFFEEEIHKIIAGEGSRNAGFNKMMALNQPGYTAKKNHVLIIVFFY